MMGGGGDVRVTWFAGVGGVGGCCWSGWCGWAWHMGKCDRYHSENPKIREKKSFLKIRNNISERRKNTSLY